MAGDLSPGPTHCPCTLTGLASQTRLHTVLRVTQPLLTLLWNLPLPLLVSAQIPPLQGVKEGILGIQLFTASCPSLEAHYQWCLFHLIMSVPPLDHKQVICFTVVT